MLMDRPAIARLIPHTGDMCLLDGVESWDDVRIACVTLSHRSVSNPLRRNGRLGILCGVEYAAQAAALHGALAESAAGKPCRGYLASLRAVKCHVDRLDLMPGLLVVDAERLYGEAGRVIYGFALRHESHVLLTGRAAVVLEA